MNAPFSVSKIFCRNRVYAVKEEKKAGGLRVPGYVSELVEWLDSAVVAIVCVVLIFTFGFRVVGVQGDSMLETLHTGDRLIISDFCYTPKRGDIVIISRVNTPTSDGHTEEPLVKRIIALGGDTVDLRDGLVYVNDQLIDEPYLEDFQRTEPRDYMGLTFPVQVPEGCIFALGDNRIGSLDSRNIVVGMMDERYILGKALLRVFPLSDFGVIGNE